MSRGTWHLARRDSLAIKFDTVWTAFLLALFYWLSPRGKFSTVTFHVPSTLAISVTFPFYRRDKDANSAQWPSMYRVLWQFLLLFHFIEETTRKSVFHWCRSPEGEEKEEEGKKDEEEETKRKEEEEEEKNKKKRKKKKIVCLFVGCLTSQQQASVSQGRICSDNFTSCHTEKEVADQTFYLTQSQYTDTGPNSPSADPIKPGAWQGSHWSANFEVTGMTRPRKKSRRKWDSNPGSSALEADALTTRPTRR